MEVDNSDILGGPIVQNGGGDQSSWFSASTITFTVLGLLGLYIAGVQVWTRVLIWKEKSYKLTMRRKYGIPDNDHRPFNVAYAAVVRKRQEEEAASRKAMVQRPPVPPQSQPEPSMRQRPGVHREQSSAVLLAVPGRFDFMSDSGYSTGTAPGNGHAARPFTDRLNFEDHYNPNPSTHVNESIYAQSSAGRTRRSSHKSLINGDSRKRSFNADGDVDPNGAKKSKFQHEETTGDEAAVPRRGYKRGASQEEEDDDEFYDSKRGRHEKRLRKVSLEKSPQYHSEMEIDDEEDQVPEMKSIGRGKKRDRAEAGSTFGGEEDDGVHEAEVDDQKSRRHRKRRNRRKSEGMPARGKKRDRDAEDAESDFDSEEPEVKVSRKKRGKKSSPKVELDDVSMDESPAPSVGSSRIKRRIGEEWESNGVKFKIGPNCQRLRQTLVKKERQKFPMPMDSQHPDRQANLEVCVETWLTEEEYREAKENHRLAWQDASKSPSEPATPAPIEIPPPSPRKGGKDLLWQSTASGLPTPQGSPPSTPAKQNGLRHSIIGNGGTPITPFQPGHASSKRIASAPRHSFPMQGYGGTPHYGSPSLTSGINGKPQLTRWEKEEMEANAIMRLRRKKDEEKKKLQEEQEKAAKEKAEKEKKEKEAAAAAAAAAAVPKLPSITVTKPEESKLAAPLFGPPSTSTQPTEVKTSLFGPSPTPAISLTTTAPASTSTSKPAESPFGFGPAPKAAEKPSQPVPFPSLGGPSASSTKPAQGSSLKFSFPTSTSASTAPKPEERNGASGAATTTQSSGPSLFTRPGAQTSSATQPSSTSTAATTSSPFSFPKSTAAEQPKQSSFFSNNASISTTTPALTTATSEPPKFSFGVTKVANATTSNSLSGALGSETKPAMSPFSFKKPDAPAQPITVTNNAPGFGAPGATGSSTPSFNFGTGSAFGGNKTEQKAPEADKTTNIPAPPAKSPFSFAAQAASGSGSATTSSSAPKPLFSFNPTASSTETSKLAFATNAEAPKTAFGNPSNAAPAMPAASATNTASMAPSFSFGMPSTTSNTSSSEPPKLSGGFGTTSSSTPTTNQASKPTFGFGGSTAGSAAPTNGDAAKPLFGGFGSSSTPSPFAASGAIGGGATGAFGGSKAGEATKAPATFSFGNPASSTSNSSATGTTPSAFGFPSTSKTSSTSMPSFGFGADASKPATQSSGQSAFGSSTTNGAPSLFGSFGAATGESGAFSFGKTPSSSGDNKS